MITHREHLRHQGPCLGLARDGRIEGSAEVFAV
jgi:hypothetical protein